MNQISHKVNFKHYIIGAVALTVEKTLLGGKTLPTVTFEISKSKTDTGHKPLHPEVESITEDAGNDKKFDHKNKWSIQLHPLKELPELLAVLMTYISECQFSFHSPTKNHGLSAQWLVDKGCLKFTFLFEGGNRFIELPRFKVFELMVFCADVMIQALRTNQTISPEQFMSLQDVESYISRAYRKFRA